MRSKYLLFFLVSLLTFRNAGAQTIVLNMPEHDDKQYYFGITFGLNYSTYRIRYTKLLQKQIRLKLSSQNTARGLTLG